MSLKHQIQKITNFHKKKTSMPTDKSTIPTPHEPKEGKAFLLLVGPHIIYHLSVLHEYQPSQIIDLNPHAWGPMNHPSKNTQL